MSHLSLKLPLDDVYCATDVISKIFDIFLAVLGKKA
jgi:hypothetical protein